MRLVLITQGERTILPQTIDYLMRRLPSSATIVGCVFTPASPYGQKKSIFSKALAAVQIFGLRFTANYGIRLIYSSLQRCSVEHVLQKHKVPYIYINNRLNSAASLKQIEGFKPDLIVSLTANEVFGCDLLALPRLGAINLHSSLLPKYRGLMPSFWVLKNREKTTGVSVFFMDHGIDSGPIHVQKQITCRHLTQWELIKTTKFLGVEAIVESVQKMLDDDFKTFPNDCSQATYFSFPTKNDVRQFRDIKGKFF